MASTKKTPTTNAKTKPPATALQKTIERLQKSVGASRDRIPLPFADVQDLFKISWLSPDPKKFALFDDLDDISDELSSWLPLGKVDGQCLMVATKAPHRAVVFMEQKWPVAPSLKDLFAKTLLGRGEKTELQKLANLTDKTYDEADKSAAKAKAVMTPLRAMLKGFRKLPAHRDDTIEDSDEVVMNAWHALGYAAHSAKDDVLSLEAYEMAHAWGNLDSVGNILLLHLDAQRFQETADVARTFLKKWTNKVLFADEAQIRARLVVALLKQADEKGAERELATWSKKANPKERKTQKKTLLEELKDYELKPSATLTKSLK